MDLPGNQSSLAELQGYVRRFCEERGWDKDSPVQKFLLFSEEVGELAKEIRRSQGLWIEKSSGHEASKSDLAHEMADVLSYLLDLANCYGIDLQAAFSDKARINAERKWDAPAPKDE